MIRAIHNGEYADDLPVFTTKQIPIVGVVVKSTEDQFPGGERYDQSAIMPVIFSPCLNTEPSGGLLIFDPIDFDDDVFSVVWCYWPETEDETRLAEVHEWLRGEARQALRRQARQQQRPTA